MPPRIVPQSADAIAQMTRHIPKAATLQGTAQLQMATQALRGLHPNIVIDIELTARPWPHHLIRAINTVAERQRFK